MKPETTGTHVGSLADEIRKRSGLDITKCYQCGKCSAGCPMSAEMRLPTHQIIRLAQLDLPSPLFNDDSIWCCLTCETCTVRCPNRFDPARLIDTLRELSLLRSDSHAPRRIQAFHRAFLSQIRNFGRVFEFGLVAEYKIRSGAFLDDITSAPGMVLKGKLAFTPHRIKNVKQVQRIFDRCTGIERQK